MEKIIPVFVLISEDAMMFAYSCIDDGCMMFKD